MAVEDVREDLVLRHIRLREEIDVRRTRRSGDPYANLHIVFQRIFIGYHLNIEAWVGDLIFKEYARSSKVKASPIDIGRTVHNIDFTASPDGVITDALGDVKTTA